jgi:hypothetical protein
LAVGAEYLRILNYRTKKLAAALEIVTKSHEPEMEPTDQMQFSFIDEEEEHDVTMNDVNNDISLSDLELPPAELHHQAVMRGA